MTLVTLSAIIDDTRCNNINGTEPSQYISEAKYYVYVPPWVSKPTPVTIPMSASDGIFDSTVESVKADIDTTGWGDGQHIIFARGQDAEENWGAFSAIFLYINDAPPDLYPPAPDPMTWATVPYTTGQNSISIY